MAGGYLGRYLWVDLSTGEIRIESLSTELQERYFGGYGIGARILYDHMPPGADPLGPENILGFVTGPLTGTPCIEGNRFQVVCKSPLTGTFGDANCGGTFGPGLKMAGFDAVFCTGQAAKPVYLYIEEGRAELRSAAHIWGQDAYASEETLEQEAGPGSDAAVIGPAGEKLSLISGIMNDHGRAAGRSGVGAVMGSKKLKAVVVRGRLPIPLHDKEKARQLRADYVKQHAGAWDHFSSTGTTGDLQRSAAGNDSAVKNWSGVGPTDFSEGLAELETERVMAYRTKKYGCYQCTLACGGWMEVQEGPYKVSRTHKVEYETGAAFGSNTLNKNFAAIIYANDLCNRYGLDTISTGAVVAFAVEAFEHGLLTPQQTGGLTLTWGNHEAIVKLTEMIALRQGIGDLLADGVQRAAERIGRGAHRFAIHIGGQEVPQHDPKFLPGLLATYVLDATPGRHTPGCEEWGFPGVAMGRHKRDQYAGRGKDHKTAYTLMVMVNAAGVCQFATWSYPFAFLPDFLEAVTGRTYSIEDLMQIGERIANLRHAFNLREGHNPLQLTIPDRLVGHPPLPAGKTAGLTLDVETLLGEVLRELDWDPVTARPSAEKLTELGLEDLIDVAAAR